LSTHPDAEERFFIKIHKKIGDIISDISFVALKPNHPNGEMRLGKLRARSAALWRNFTWFFALFVSSSLGTSPAVARSSRSITNAEDEVISAEIFSKSNWELMSVSSSVEN
jgi:hypothetical protein